jgi:hypothetical protein
MNNQTLENEQNNRVQENKKDLENEIRSTWLERRDLNLSTFGVLK